MAGRSGGTNVPAVVYKDFQPRVDGKEEQGANILVIHLPDFPKEQINVTYVDATRSIKVQAEKALEKNTRSRINQAFPVPENCIIEKIQGSLRNGLLTITMPKRTLTQLPKEQIAPPVPKPSASAVEKQVDQKLKSPPKPISQPKPPVPTTPPKPISELKPPVPTTVPKPISEPKPPVPTTVPKPISEPKTPAATVAKPIAEPKPLTATVAKPISESKPPMVTAPQIPKEKTGKKEVEALPPSKQQEVIQRKASPIAKQTGEEKAGGSMATTPEIVEKKSETTDGLKDLVKEKAKDPMPEAADIPKASEKTGTVEKKPKEGGGGFLEMKGTGMDRIMKTVKRLGTEDAEDRQLLINIGVSVLVIVALGAYITYSYRSSGKPKN
ncbi:hypothetical protein V6N13_018851 [Hibiscus sabdariffa]|uniref:SHSP domain-containing protein n=1 Tax=Hibiscus sabdariffa TaxID=183260 RepID=A0ABR2EKP6_9ROSI